MQNRSTLVKSAEDKLDCSPIGFVRSSNRNKFDVPHQPERTTNDVCTIELIANRDLHKATEDLDGFEYVWILSWFHKNTTWKPKVMPPRGPEKKRGLFATRSPHRPNPIGITVAKLVSVDGLKLTVSGTDLIDGTPVLDIKPYIAYVDALPDARAGWLEEIEAHFACPPSFDVVLEDLAKQQRSWLKEHGVDFFERAFFLLRRDPSEHKTRRISKYGENLYRMGCAEWRLFFSLEGQTVSVKYFRPGYPREQLLKPGFEVIPNRDAQLKFIERWPS
jgi:tRNA (adenine37-N6)-methyltransferase